MIAIIDRMGLDEDTPIEAKLLSNTIEGAQSRIEEQNFKRRKYVLSYDDVMNQQRTLIYKQRREVLDDKDMTDKILNMIRGNVEDTVSAHTADDIVDNWDLAGLRSIFMGYLTTDDDFKFTDEEKKKLKREDISDMLIERAENKLKEKEELFTPDVFHEVERAILLQNVDRAWMDHIDGMDDLKGSIGLQSYAHRDPVVEYRMVGADMFDAMIAEIRDKTVRMILTVIPKPEQEITRVQVAKPMTEGFDGGEKKSTKKVTISQTREASKVGRNDPCPCGSGKKYKNCCGSNANRVQ
jgi:preprotein translocase subunit SecA